LDVTGAPGKGSTFRVRLRASAVSQSAAASSAAATPQSLPLFSKSVDRARAQSSDILRRSLAELRKLQTGTTAWSGTHSQERPMPLRLRHKIQTRHPARSSSRSEYCLQRRDRADSQIGAPDVIKDCPQSGKRETHGASRDWVASEERPKRSQKRIAASCHTSLEPDPSSYDESSSTLPLSAVPLSASL